MHSVAGILASCELLLKPVASEAPEHASWCKELAAAEMSDGAAYPTALEISDVFPPERFPPESFPRMVQRRDFPEAHEAWQRAHLARLLASDAFRDGPLFETFVVEARAREARGEPLDVLDTTVLAPPRGPP